MRVEVGKEYMCGGIRVKAVGLYDNINKDRRCMVCCVEDDGDGFNDVSSGMFDSYDGEYSSDNPEYLMHWLEEIPEEVTIGYSVEMTVAEVAKKLGIDPNGLKIKEG